MKSDLTKQERAIKLEERTLKFSESIIKFCNSLEYSSSVKILINQLVRSATSIGANYIEANNSSSKRDFRNKIYICRKEANETRYWLKLMLSYYKDNIEIYELIQESQEFCLIFDKITDSLSGDKK
ncbi:MAG: four helix bundle protein [Patescibacteria group bacterium]|nr:four helix bundle protein [Patescibacteria group bacterium]